MSFNRRLLCVLAGVAACASAAHAAPNLLQNGSFESPAGYFQTFTTSGQGLTGWTVTANSVDVASNAIYGSSNYAVDGTQWLDLVGNGIGGGLTQSFATAVGTAYTLSFSYANNPDFSSEAALVTVNGLGSLLSEDITHSSSTRATGNWIGYSATFVADASTSTLTFTDTSGRTSAGIYLDAVSVTAAQAAAVPEPATLTLVLVGIGAAGTLARRRRGSAGIGRKV